MSTCYADPNPTFQMPMRLIASITNANPAVVTTTFAHGYLTGLVVTLKIPRACGMQQADEQTGEIVVTGDTTFTINIDTTGMDIFSIPVGAPGQINTCAQVVPDSENNAMLTAATQNITPPF